jgi:Zn-dependent oligopeptidase
MFDHPGYMNYAEMSLVTKMAGSVESVNTMLLSMLAGARTAQELELASLQVTLPMLINRF